MKIKWEEKRIYEEEIEIEKILEDIENNWDFDILSLDFTIVVVKEWLCRFGKYSMSDYTDDVIKQIAKVLFKKIEEQQKVTLVQIAEEIEDLISYLQPHKYFPEAINKEGKILNLIEKYKNGE